MSKTTVLITGPDELQCEAVRKLLEGQPDLEVTRRALPASQPDPLQGVTPMPDVLIPVLGTKADEMLKALQARPQAGRIGMIIIGNDADAQLMRRAMQAGARDYFAPPLQRGELLQAIRMIGREKGAEAQPGAPLAEMTAVINAKGGSGASFIAVNLAHIAATERKAPAGLLDLDLQFGALPLALDLEQRNSLLEALGGAAQLDATALQGYMAKHASGVHVLSAMSEQLPLPWDIPTESLGRVLTIARQSYGRVIVDLPRQIDPLTSTVLSQASHIVVVMQQSLAHVRDAKRMLRVMINNLGVPRENIVVVVNRHNEKDAVRLSDIVETVNPPTVVTLPNDFNAVSESLNTGVPMLDFARHAPLARALQDLAAKLEKREAPEAASGNGAKKRSLRQMFSHPFGA